MGTPVSFAPPTSHVTNFVHAERISLKSDSAYDECWLEAKVKENPTALGLGELTNITNQITQRGAGRLDLQADDVKNGQRYVIELMLGELDGDHLVRIIDYWIRRSRQDIESDREVVAVLAAEKIALARYFGVVQFLAEHLAKVMPFIVMEVTALRVGSATTLLFNKIIDNSLSRVVNDDEQPRVVVDRGAWAESMSPENLALLDELFALLKTIDARIEQNYLPQYIGIKIENRSINFSYFNPRKKFIQIDTGSLRDASKWVEMLTQGGATAEANGDKVNVKLKPVDFDTCKEALKGMFTDAHGTRIRTNA